jgi:hypothetical protein
MIIHRKIVIISSLPRKKHRKNWKIKKAIRHLELAGY